MRNRLFYRNTIIALAGWCVLLMSCDRMNDKLDGDDDVVPIPPTTSAYLAMSNRGDVVRYSVSNNYSYNYNNETTADSGNGMFTVAMDTNYRSLYTTPLGSAIHYAIELAGGIFVTCHPSGYDLNRLVVGMPANKDLSVDYTPADLAGDYAYIKFAPNVNNIVTGGYRINANGSYTWGVIPQNADPDLAGFSFNDYVNGGSQTGAGSWVVDSTNKTRILFTETGASAVVGTINPGIALLINNGSGQGFTLGFRYPAAAVAQSQIAGTYRFIDVTSNGNHGHGWYQIPASGSTVYWWVELDDGEPALSGTSTDFRMFAHLNGAGVLTYTVGSETYRSILIMLSDGELMHYRYRSTDGAMEMVSFGVGAKKN